MSAVFSPCGLYRYRLIRDIETGFWEELDANLMGEGPAVRPLRTRLYVMLNPSYAGADKNDPTARRTMGFGARDGFGRILVGNAFGIVETDSSLLRHHADPVGPDNDRHLAEMAAQADQIIVAWGARAKFPKSWAHREREVLDLLRAVQPVFCLGKTKDGSPNHPLYLPNTQPVLPYP
jgi:hypothetical protein